ncbi:MAG: serine O-acetyltransferase EpsC [Lautropia sp.]|nr:serine O-acetyltransferase EpsC [Lautropia sp.]
MKTNGNCVELNSGAPLSFGVDETVARLRVLRDAALQSRRPDGTPPLLPSRQVLSEVVNGLAAALFPHRLGRPDLCSENIDHYVGYTLDLALSSLYHQIRREILFTSGQTSLNDADVRRAQEIIRIFSERLPAVRELLDTDVAAAYQGDPAARSLDEVLVCYPGVWAMIHHRLAHLLYEQGMTLTARVIGELAHSVTGIDIHPGATIGDHFFIDHGTGVVIGETAIIGSRVRLYQNVTLGAKRFRQGEDGSLVKGEARHPILEDEVVIYAGATVLGRVTIGRGSVIGGNVWLTRSVPSGSMVSQALAVTAPEVELFRMREEDAEIWNAFGI